MAPVWRKSSRSGSSGGSTSDCVEIANVHEAIGIRDSRNPQGGHLTVPRFELRRLVDLVKGGELDLK